MTEIVIPSALRVARSSFKYIDQTGVSRGVFSGTVQTTGYGGDRVGVSLDFTPAGGTSSADKSLRAQIKAVLMASRGKQNRIFAEDNSTTRRGSFPATELFSNYDFSNGTTGWTASSPYTTFTVADGAAKLTVAAVGSNPQVSQSVAVTQYAPYVVRSIIEAGLGLSGIAIGPVVNDGALSSSNYSTTRGYLIASAVALSASAGSNYAAVVSVGSGYLPGDYIRILFTSLSRCFLADGGANMLQRSDELGNAYWTVSANSSISSNASVAPDGTSTAEHLVEGNTANIEHYVTPSAGLTVAAAAADYTLTCAVRPDARDWVLLRLSEATGSTYAFAWFNVTTGALGATSSGANWSNVRSSIVSMGNSWYQCTITARKTNAATSVSCILQSANGNSVTSYAGTAATSAIRLWRATLSQSSSPVRLRQAVAAAVTADSQTAGAIYVKGLPASTAGLLLAGDWVEIDGQLKMVTESLDSDAGGLGYLQFSPPLRRAVSDNTPIIVNRPMGRFILAGDAMWNNVPGVFSDASIELEEAWS